MRERTSRSVASRSLFSSTKLTFVLFAPQIAIPFEVIADVETTTSMEFAETIEIKVVEGEDSTLSFDSYFFAYFTDIDAALVQIREAIAIYRPQVQGSVPGWEKEQVYDTTTRIRRGSTPAEGATKPTSTTGSSLSRISSLLHPFGGSTSKASLSASAPASPRQSKDGGSAPIPISSRQRSRDLEGELNPVPARISTTPDSIRTVTPPSSLISSSTHVSQHSYPPEPSGAPPPDLGIVHSSSTSAWAPSKFIKRPSMKIFSSGASGASSLLSAVRPSSLVGRKKKLRKVVESVENVTATRSSAETDVSFSEDSTDGYEGSTGAGFSLMEKSETVDREELEADADFHEWFAMDKKEALLERE